MLVSSFDDQCVIFDNVELLKIKEVSDYKEVYILNKEKFKYKEILINKKFKKDAEITPDFTKKFISIGDNIYINLKKVVMIEAIRVPNTLEKYDITVYLNNSTPFNIRSNINQYDLLLRRLREV